VICRFSALLPFDIWMPVSPVMPLVRYRRRPYTVTIHPFVQATIGRNFDPSSSMRENLKGLRPADRPAAASEITITGGPVVVANLLQIDFQRSRFDRHPPALGPDQAAYLAAGDPPPALGFQVANHWIANLRTTYRAPQLVPLNPSPTPWRMDYMHDDGSPLRRRLPLLRSRYGGQVSWKVFAAHTDAWKVAADLGPDYEPPVWQALILDALRLLPDVNAPLVLAFAAIETLVGEALPVMPQTTHLPPGLWEWIASRDNNYLRQPGTDEELDALFHILAGQSLKTDGRLWSGFKELRKARNSLAHTGTASMLNGRPVTATDVTTLVGLAVEITDWIEARLPPAYRRPTPPAGPEAQFTALF
jgi:hypothetical protein